MSLTFGSQAKPALATIAAPLLALAPGAAAAVAGVALARRLRAAPRSRRVLAALAVAAGILLALAGLMAGPLPAHSGIEQLFAARGWWDIGAVELLGARLPEALGAALALIVTPLAAMPLALRVVVAGFLLTLTLMVATALAASAHAIGARQPARILIDVGAGLVLVLVAAVVVVYAAYALLWLAAYLNFWAFALMLIALQRWRHGAI